MENGKTALGLDKNVGALLCYLPICLISVIYSIIVLVTEKNDSDMRFHAFQSLILTVIYVVGIVIVSFIGGIIGAALNSAMISLLFSLLSFVIIIAFLGLMIMGCVKGYQGVRWKMPVVGNIADGMAK